MISLRGLPEVRELRFIGADTWNPAVEVSNWPEKSLPKPWSPMLVKARGIEREISKGAAGGKKVVCSAGS